MGRVAGGEAIPAIVAEKQPAARTTWPAAKISSPAEPRAASAGAAAGFAENSRNLHIRVQRNAGSFRGGEDGASEGAIVDGGFVGHQGGSAGFASDGGLEPAGFVDGQRLGGEAEPAMQCDQGAELALGIRREKQFDGAVAAEGDAQAGGLLDRRDPVGIEREAGAAEGHQGNCAGAIRPGREHARSGPGGLAPGIAALDQGHAQLFLREGQGDRSTDNASADDRNIVRTHAAILAAMGERGSEAQRSHVASGRTW